MGREAPAWEAIERLQIDTRAQGEVRRLSGGNQQKVTIARWIARGWRRFCCFDPTRGIDIRTKRQIYRARARPGRAGLRGAVYTSELAEVQLACDRAVVIFGGRVVDVIDAADADEPTLMRAAYGLTGMRLLRRNAWVAGLCVLFVLMLVLAKLVQPNYGAAGFESLARAALPYAFATAAQAVVVIAGGIDLSIASMMAVTSVTAAVMMQGASEGQAVLVVLFVLGLGTLMGVINGVLIVVTRVPDIVVTLAMLFVWEGVALLILASPGGRRRNG
jgi:energy-coupling factor transporter ATP-binding protein EcfA2